MKIRSKMICTAKCRDDLVGKLNAVHYINLRSDPATQKEHRDIAEAMKKQFIKKFPAIAEAAGWI